MITTSPRDHLPGYGRVEQWKQDHPIPINKLQNEYKNMISKRDPNKLLLP
jgi:hypothetical protein